MRGKSFWCCLRRSVSFLNSAKRVLLAEQFGCCCDKKSVRCLDGESAWTWTSASARRAIVTPYAPIISARTTALAHLAIPETLNCIVGVRFIEDLHPVLSV